MWYSTTRFESPAPPAAGTSRPAELSLLRGFELRRGGETVNLPQTSQRVLAFLALHERPLQRPYVAGSLWPQVSDRNADGSLRSALWRMKDLDADLVEAAYGNLSLGDRVATDVGALILGSRALSDRSASDLTILAGGYEEELLPDWYDDWVIEWRERWRQIRFHALEDVARIHIGAGRFGSAIEVGLAAVRAEPLRESAHRVVIEAHLAEGNLDEAVREFRRFELLLREELDVAPSPRLIELVGALIRP